MKRKIKPYRFFPDTHTPEVIVCRAVEPNDNAVTDADIYNGRVGSTHHGQYYKDSSESLNPLHRRGVDFTDVGNILSVIDSQEESTSQKVSAHRRSLTPPDKSNQSDDQK